MRKPFGILRRLFAGGGGTTSVEYAIMLSLIAAICVAGVRTIGANAATAPARLADSLSNGSGVLGSNPPVEISVKDKPVHKNAGHGKANGS
jgi:Flp pilus assembly pilin Flp